MLSLRNGFLNQPTWEIPSLRRWPALGEDPLRLWSENFNPPDFDGNGLEE
jgi:hypothetical protein